MALESIYDGIFNEKTDVVSCMYMHTYVTHDRSIVIKWLCIAI